MYELYVSETCPYSIKVINYFMANNIPFVKKVITDRAYYEELMDLGGMHQVPFLYNPDDGTKMYESDEIIEYAEKNR